MWVFDAEKNTTSQVQLPNHSNQYLSAIKWLNNGSLAYFVLDRIQQKQELWAFSVEEKATVLLNTQTDAHWIDPYYQIHSIRNGEQVILMQAREDRKHFVLFDRAGLELKDLNKGGEYDVEDFLGFDEESGIFYFTAHSPTPLNLNVFALDIETSITQLLSGGDLVHATAVMSPSRRLSTLYTYGEDIPNTKIISNRFGVASPLIVLEDNAAFNDSLSGLAMPTREYWTIPSASEEYQLNAVAYLPPGWDPKGDLKYPVLLYVYGGPDSQTVNFQFELGSWNFHSFLASSMGIIVLSVDNRGTCCRGQTFLKQSYKDLGHVETEDQIAAMHYASELPFVDSSKVAIWGWSYGGYMAARVISSGEKVVRGAISVAPVTDWRFYDSVYTERYMQTPQLNPDGYQASAVLPRASQVQTEYLLVHGTGDDNVHFQNSADWVTSLVNAGVDLQTMYYPDKAHSLSGIATRTHLWKLLSRFCAKIFSLPTPLFDPSLTPKRSSRRSHTSNTFKGDTRPGIPLRPL